MGTRLGQACSHWQEGQDGQQRYHEDEQPGGAAVTWHAAATA